MREQVEESLYPGVASIVAPEALTDANREKKRKNARSRAAWWGRGYLATWSLSAVAFVVGVVMALSAVKPDDAPKAGSESRKSGTSKSVNKQQPTASPPRETGPRRRTRPGG